MDIENAITESNLNTCKEMILDEDKIVTYISLSKHLCIHINLSKILLSHVLQNIRNVIPNIKLKVNYIIAGIADTNKARTVVCPESELNEIRVSFKYVNFEHIYSISKVDVGNNATYLYINNYRDFSLCLGSLRNSNCVKHSSCEIKNIKSNSLIVLEPSVNKTDPIKKVKTEGIGKWTSGTKVNVPAKTVSIPKNEANLNSKIILKMSSPEKEKKYSEIKQNGQKMNGKTGKGIAGFFNKSMSNNKNEQAPKEYKVKIEKMEIEDVEAENLKENKINEINNEIIIKEESKNDFHVDIKNKTLKQIIKSSKVDTKRKRVLHVSDSDSENEVEKEQICPDSDDEIPPTPMTNIKITSGIVNPKKKRKFIDKTYTDDEGYILTKKVEVYESCSEDEVSAVAAVDIKVNEVKKDISPKIKTESKSRKKKITSPQKGKQAVLTNFFKRK